MLIDTHCHLFFDAFDADRDEVVRRAKSAGVKYLINVGTDGGTNQKARDIAGRYEGVFWTAGLHPHSAHQVTDKDLDALEEFVAVNKPSAIGEIGIDYFKSEADRATQKKVFVRMLQIALKQKLPVIVHSRNAFRDTADIIRSESGGALEGVMHCFSYDQTAFEELIRMGFIASFTGNLTFKKADAVLLEVAKSAPLDKIMLETDSPYLAPQACRGKRNEPSYLVHLAEFLSEIRGLSRAELEAATTRTAARFFNLPVC